MTRTEPLIIVVVARDRGDAKRSLALFLSLCRRLPWSAKTIAICGQSEESKIDANNKVCRHYASCTLVFMAPFQEE